MVDDPGGRRATQGALELWTMATPPPAEHVLAKWHALLDAEERAQAARFVFAANRHEYIAAHGLARLLLSHVAARAGGVWVAPAAWCFYRQPGGKPTLLEPEGGISLAFNLSHTGGRVAVATGQGALELGVDVEAVSRKVDPALARQYFTPREAAWLDGQTGTACNEAFLRLWTLKEAYLKAHGGGLPAGLDSVGFDLSGATPRLVTGDPAPGAWWFGQWRLAPEAENADHVLALACRGGRGAPNVTPRRLAAWQWP